MYLKKRVQLVKDFFLIIAHRGASAYAPEHTIAAYELAKRMGADYIEIDVNRTKDNKLVAVHDVIVPYVEGNKRIADFTLAELKQFSPGVKFNNEHPKFMSPEYTHLRTLELEEVFAHFNNTVNFYIELKSPHLYPGIEEQFLQALHAHKLPTNIGSLPQIIIQSFDATCLKKIFKFEKRMPLIKLYNFKNEATLSTKDIRALKKYASGIGVNFDSLTPAFIQRIQSEGLHIHAFTVNKEEDIRTAINLGINGVFTDYPDVGIEIRRDENGAC